jgi:processive 1,2-diacylglycerol beta-glucosyltransferase
LLVQETTTMFDAIVALAAHDLPLRVAEVIAPTAVIAVLLAAVWPRLRRGSSRPAGVAPGGTTSERVLVVSASVGAGHDGAAHELARRLRGDGAVVEVRDFLDALPRWLRFTLRDGYTRTVNHTPWFYDWLYTAMEKPGPARRAALLVCRLAQPQVLRWLRTTGADAVVSTYPLASQTIAQLVRRGRVAVPTTTYLTDPSVHALWVDPDIGRHLTTLTATADLARRQYGVPMTVAGPLVPDRFTVGISPARRAELREELGVEPGRPVALIASGSLGLGRVEDTVDAVVATGIATPLVLCGRNDRLRRDLARRPGVLALGWRDDVQTLMGVADVLVHNAGGMSFSESLVAGLPAVTFRCIPGHGRANGEVLARAGIAPLADTVDELARALTTQLRPGAATVLRETLAAAPEDASQVVLRDLRTASVPAQLRAARARRVSVRRRWSAAGAAALVAVTSLAATEGAAAATRHGFGVAQMPAHSVALVVAPDSLAPLRDRTAELAAAQVAVLVPARPTSQDATAARDLAAAGVPLLAAGCSPATLLTHRTAQQCGATRVLAAAGVQTSPVVLSDGVVEAPELVVSRRDRTRIVIGTVADRHGTGTGTGDPSPRTASGVRVVRQGPGESAPALIDAVDREATQARAAGLTLRPVTDARTRR